MKPKKEQKTTWKEAGYCDLRSLVQHQKLPAEEIVGSDGSVEGALLTLEQHIGFIDEIDVELNVTTPLGNVTIARRHLNHIVEKRQDARERYVKYALATMKNPLEIWLVGYEDENGGVEFRHAYIGAFEGKTQMLVVFTNANGTLLWNFMQSDSKSLNKHRHGECLYKRT